jgi:hypothetical protein
MGEMGDWIAFGVVGVLILALGSSLARRNPGSPGAQYLTLGLAFRIIGSFLRFEVIERVYAGVGDSKVYFEWGKVIASNIWDGDFSLIIDGVDGRWYGSQFISSVTGIVCFFVGDHIRAAFLVFSVFGFVGLVLCVQAFGEALGPEAERAYARACWLWPSLWFWPSSIGKESLMLLATGLIVRGYVGVRGAPSWAGLVGGLALAGAIRPHVAAVLALSVAIAETMRRSNRQVRGRNVLNLFLTAVLAAIAVRFGLSRLGLGDADLEGIQENFEFRATHTERGGSNIGHTGGVLAIPMAVINVLFRPFPWEARGAMILSSAEVVLFWALVYRNRKAFLPVLKQWRTNRFFVVAAPFALGMTLMYGLAFANLGIIARQRIVILPFLVALIAIPARRQVAAAVRPALTRRTQGVRAANQWGGRS